MCWTGHFTTNFAFLRAQNLFVKKNRTQNCPGTLIYYTTELCSLNFVVIKLLLPIYQYSQDSSTDFSNTRVKKKKFLTLNQNHNLVQPSASTFSCFVEILCVTAYSEYRLSMGYSEYRLSTLILIVSCVVTHMSNPLSHSAIW